MKTLALLALMSLAGYPAFAYVPPSSFILRKVAAKHLDVKTIKVRSVVSALENEKATGVRFRDVTLYSASTQTLRSIALHETENRELYVIERKRVPLRAVPALLFEAQTARLIQIVKDAEVPVKPEQELLDLATEEERRGAEVSSLARFAGSIAWVIGRKDRSEPQLWVEKDTFLPVRLLFTSSEGLADIWFEKFRYQKDFGYPRLVTYVKTGNVGVLQAELTDIVVNPELAELKTAVESGFTDAGDSSPGALRELIRRYYEILR